MLGVSHFAAIIVESRGNIAVGLLVMNLREFQSDDLESVAGLFLRTFRPDHKEQPSPPASLISYIESLFLKHPFASPLTPSWTALSDDGSLLGFIGVLPFPMLIGERQIL